MTRLAVPASCSKLHETSSEQAAGRANTCSVATFPLEYGKMKNTVTLTKPSLGNLWRWLPGPGDVDYGGFSNVSANLAISIFSHET
jgi:hypothetical protein